MFLHYLKLRVQNIKKMLDKTVYVMWSQILEKTAEKGPLKMLKRIQKKSTKNMKLSTFFCGFRGLNNSSYQISEATFQQAIFPLLSFFFWSQEV